MSRKGENERRNKSPRAEERRLSWKAWLRRNEVGGWLEKRERGKRQGAASEKRRLLDAPPATDEIDKGRAHNDTRP
jgi:hypothetical protein